MKIFLYFERLFYFCICEIVGIYPYVNFNRNIMQFRRYILLVVLLFTLSCTTDELLPDVQQQDGPVKVGFWMGDGVNNTRTTINDDGQTVSWEASDKVALWATGDAYTFQNKEFNTWFVSAETNQAFFTTTLPEAMPEGTYTYYACYPLPQSVSEGTKATFTLPSMQDGKMGGGADIMVAQGDGPELAKLYIPEEGLPEGQKPDYVLDQNRLSLRMRHLIHALRFYVPQAKWGFPSGETVERIVFTMPQSVAGTVTADVSSADGGLTLTSNESKSITLSLDESLTASASRENGVVDYDYAVAAIIPPSTTYGANDMLEVTAYSQKRFVTQQISLSGRGPQATNEKMRMAAGSVTPVGLDCSEPSNPKISFRIKSNNLGENPYRITLESANTYAKWSENSNYIYIYDTGSENKTIAVGDGFELYSDFESISTIWGNKVKVTYESKSAIVTQTIDLPEMELRTNYIVDLDVPYLFYEDFTNIGVTDNSQADVGQATWLQNINPSINLPGWSGSMWKTDAENKLMEIRSFIRSMNCGYKNASGVRFGRIDTAPIPLKQGKKVKIQVSYNVGGKKEGENGSVRCYFGYSNSNTLQNGGTAGTNQTFTPNYPTKVVEDFLTGNVSSAPSCNVGRNPSVEFESTPEVIRLSWLLGVDIKHSSVDSALLGTHLNTVSSKTFYLYLDNIQVQIVSE